MIYYKATDPQGRTRGGMDWTVPGTVNEATGRGTELCTDGVLHVYRTPEQAAFMIPVHVLNYTRLFEVEVPEIVADDGAKCGCKRATVIREVPMPVLTIEQRVGIAIRVSLLVYSEPGYVRWAEGWLSGKDRSADAAYAARAAADAAHAAYAADAAAHAAYAADAAAHAADADDAAAHAAYAADAAAHAADADDAAAYAAYAAHAAYAADAGKSIDLLSIIETVLSKEAT